MSRPTEESKVNYILEHREMSNRELATELDLSYSTVRSIRRRLGCKQIKEINNIKDEDIIKLYNECKSVTTVGDILNIDRHRVSKILNSYGIKTSKKYYLNKEEIDEICAMYWTYSSTELSKIYNVSVSLINSIWNKNRLYGKSNRIYHLDNERYFENIDTDIKAYFLGFIASDGCVYHTDKSKQDILRICIQKEDISVLEKLKEELGTDKPIHIDRDSYASIEIVSDILCNDLKKYNIVPNKTYKFLCPDILDDKYILPFLRGYVDGDGGVGDMKIYISGYINNLEWMKCKLEKLNILLNITEDNRKYKNNENGYGFGYLINTNLTQMYCMCKALYDNDNFALNRKKERALNNIYEIENNQDIVRYKQIVIYYNCGVLPLC